MGPGPLKVRYRADMVRVGMGEDDVLYGLRLYAQKLELIDDDRRMSRPFPLPRACLRLLRQIGREGRCTNLKKMRGSIRSAGDRGVVIFKASSLMISIVVSSSSFIAST